MISKKYNHGGDVNKHQKEILASPQKFVQKIDEFLREVNFMETFYQLPKLRQRQIEPKYYAHEKRLLAYLIFGDDKKIKDRFILYLVRIYQTLVFKYIGWYEKSLYKSLYFSTDEIKTTLEAHLVSTIYHFCEKIKSEGVRIPFGTYLKNRIFLQFRGELQDIYRKTILYDQWKDRLYEKSLPRRTQEEINSQYEEVSEQMELLKNNILLESPKQKDDFDYSFMYNYIFVYNFFNKKPLQKIEDAGYSCKTICNDIKQDIKVFKEKLGNQSS